MKKLYLSLTVAMIYTVVSFAQFAHKDSAIFIQPKNAFWDSIKTSLDTYYHRNDTTKKKAISLDFSTYDAPKAVADFTQYWHTPPISQGNTGTCWCFSTTSFLESDIYRESKREFKFSEMYTVYWEYVEKALGYVRSRGNQTLGEGSEADAVFRIWNKYGCVPEKDYTGLPDGQPFHDHSKLFDEIEGYLKSLKKSNAWDENTVVSTVKSILNHYLGTPPSEITVDGKQMTPKEYFDKVVKINLNDYISLCSFSDKPYYSWVEYNVPDNWWHGKKYFNVPLDVYMSALKKAVKDGYTMAIWGDNSEPGYNGYAGIAVVPSYDIPSQYINASSRIFRFYNHTSTDDHGLHLIGYTQKDGKDWYLIKDSASSSRNNSHRGYYFMSSNYVKLKMLGFMVNKSAVPEIVKYIK